MKFRFETDERAQEFCEAIANQMINLFGISIHEAIGRINREWHNNPIIGDDIIYHETEEYWAKNIYFGKASEWWLSPPGLMPKPFP
jgi:hypothetical protein